MAGDYLHRKWRHVFLPYHVLNHGIFSLFLCICLLPRLKSGIITFSKFLKVAFTMIIRAALCIPCLQHEKLVVTKPCSFLPSEVLHRLMLLLSLCSCTPGWGWKWVRTICLQLLSGPCAQFTFHWYHGVGNREGSSMTWFVVFALASWWPHSQGDLGAGGCCCVLHAFWQISIIHYMLCLSQPWLLTLYMALEAWRLWEDNWIFLGRHVVMDLDLLTLIEKMTEPKCPLCSQVWL